MTERKYLLKLEKKKLQKEKETQEKQLKKPNLFIYLSISSLPFFIYNPSIYKWQFPWILSYCSKATPV